MGLGTPSNIWPMPGSCRVQSSPYHNTPGWLELPPNVVSPSLRYSVEGFLDKNKDTLFQDFKRLFYNRLGTQGTQLRGWWHSHGVGVGFPVLPAPHQHRPPARTLCCMPCGLTASRASPRSPSAR